MVDHLHECVEGLKSKVADIETGLAANTAMTVEVKKDIAENTKVTTEVRDILTTFKMVGKFAKWLGAIVAAVATAIAAVKGLRG